MLFRFVEKGARRLPGRLVFFLYIKKRKRQTVEDEREKKTK